MELRLVAGEYYRVKRGQTVASIARTFGMPARVLAQFNGLKCEVYAGQVLRVPQERRNLYTVRGGESKSLLCGSEKNFEERNATGCLYPGQIVWL